MLKSKQLIGLFWKKWFFSGKNIFKYEKGKF